MSATDERACDFGWSLARERALFDAPGLPVISSGGSMPARNRGGAVSMELQPIAGATFVIPPERQPEPGTFAGTLRTSIEATGLYQVTLSEEAWVDLSQDGRTALSAVAHTGRRACPGLRKSLRFNLSAGPLDIQISNAKGGSMRIGFLRAE